MPSLYILRHKQVVMSSKGFFACVIFMLCAGLCSAQGTYPIIPAPHKIAIDKGYFTLPAENNLNIYVKDGRFKFPADYLKEQLQLFYGITAKAGNNNVAGQQMPQVELKFNPDIKGEAYHISITTNNIVAEAGELDGMFNAVTSMVQLFDSINTQIPCGNIADAPAYKWRGMHLDVCRHFFDKAFIKRYIDLMALYKFNVFHWHLTDDQGWRIEIKKYPLLTTIGAWRTEKDGSKYGGFYTQDDIREIVAYAAQHRITVVPEIDIPGHSSAAIAAYPWLSCYGGNKTIPNTWGIKPDILCPTDSTFMFVKDVLDEVMLLFPSTYIHVGGDEAPKTAWKNSSAAQAVIKQQGLKNEDELQSYFLKVVEDYLVSKGRKPIAWGEAVSGGFTPHVTVMSWLDKNAGKRAAENKHDAIMSPRFFCYFDYPQAGKDPVKAIYMTYITPKKALSLNPIPLGLDSTLHHHILGGQGNVWTEHMKTNDDVTYQTLPRMAALAEALWTNKNNYTSFKTRLQKQFMFYNKWKVNYCDVLRSKN